MRTLAAQRQTACALGILFAMGLTAALIEQASRDPRIARWIDEPRREYSRRCDLFFADRGYFIDDEDRLLLEELPQADFSQGGVYLIGSSNVVRATLLRDLPQQERDGIFNFGISASNHTMQFQFLRYLVEDRKLLRAGGRNCLVMFGAVYHYDARAYEPDGFFVNLWRRHGLFDCDRQRGIRVTGPQGWWRDVIIEKIRLAGFLAALQQQVTRVVNGAPDGVPRQHDPEVYNRRWENFMGPNWKENLQDQMIEFAEMVEYLKMRDVQLAVTFLPYASWEFNLPYQEAYQDAMTRFCEARGIPCYDFSRLLTDDEFSDATHPNMRGMQKLQPKLLSIAHAHLQATHAAPPPR